VAKPAQEALSSHPEVSVYLSCRISLYEKDGEVVLSTIGIEDMMKNFDLDDDFKSHMNGIFEKLKMLLSSWDSSKKFHHKKVQACKFNLCACTMS